MPYPRGKKWVGQVRKMGQGKEHRREKKFETKTEAKDWEAMMRRKPVEEWDGTTGTASLYDWAEAYLDYAEARFSVKTYKEKRTMFRCFFQSIDHELPVGALTPGMVMDYIIKQSQERSGYAANKDRKNLVAAWNWGMKYHKPLLPGPNPCLVDRMPEKRHPRYIPSVKDFWKVYDTAEGQDRLMLLAFLHLGARRGEVFRLTWDDVDFGHAQIRLGTHKRAGGHLEYDWLPLTDDLFNALLAHRQTAEGLLVFPNPKTGEAFRTRKRWMSYLCKRAKVKPFGFHAIRHLTASILADAGVPAVQIQAILRHKKLGTTERYLHQMGDLKPALRLLSRDKKPSGEPSVAQRTETKIRAVK